MLGRSDFNTVLSKMQWTWILCFGSLTVLVSLGLLVSNVWMPMMGLVLMVPIMYFVNLSVAKNQPICTLINHYAIYALFLSSVVMVVINLINTRWFVNWLGHDELESLQSDIPFVAPLVVYPVACIMYGVAMLRRSHTEYCRACKEQAGFSLRESLQRNVLHGEARFQIKLICGLCFLMSVLGWTYYLLYYISVNINKVDTFFFCFVPIAVYVISVLYIYMRYASMQFKVSISSKHYDSDAHTELRFMVIKGDKIMLEPIVKDVDGSQIWDTPAHIEMPYIDDVTQMEAIESFSHMSGTDDFTLRRLFSTTRGGVANCVHFAVFLDEKTETPGLDGTCFTLYEVNDMMKTGHVARSFAYELHRVFTITMAWKTYTREGKRLYPIKNYRPTFRLADFKDWDVDYSDLHWLSISRNNEDQPFYRLRRFWRNHISGIDLRWGRKRY